MTKQTPSRIWLSSPHMGGKEQKYVQDAFNTNWIAPLGPNVDGFENDICNYVNVKASLALSSGTAGLHIGLKLLGAGPGDEVICQTMTFSASANPIRYVGADPVFVDSEPDSWNMDPDLMEEAIKDRLAKGKKIKAIIPVHLYGMPADMERICRIADKYEIPILEDAAEAVGSRIKGRFCGSYGKLGVLSFNGNKIITTSGGGALLSDDIAMIQKALYLSTQARDNVSHYQHSEIGYNYRMSNILAGIGRGQIQVLEQRVGERRKNFDFYRSLFKDINGIEFQEEPLGRYSNRWLTTITVDPDQCGGISSEIIREALEKKNIEARPLWKPMHLQPVFKGCPYYGNGVSESLFEKGLCLPSGTNMDQEDLARIEGVIAGLFEKNTAGLLK
jgi:dTDP-4-amino-4,6-dideoxygalactose transaminase